MKIQIIGLGVVGSAQAYLAARLGHDVVGYDVAVTQSPYCEVVFDYVVDADITFICTPELVVEEVIDRLVTRQVGGVLVIKSTVPIGTTTRLEAMYGLHLCHNPEFLREKYALKDVMDPSRIVIGQCCPTHGDVLRTFYAPLGGSIFVTDPVTSETVKLVSNSFRALTITFWNEIALLCEKAKINVEEIALLADPGKVIGEYEGGRWGTRQFLTPYGGKCLPKDMKQLIHCFYQHGLNPEILVVSDAFNTRLKTGQP